MIAGQLAVDPRSTIARTFHWSAAAELTAAWSFEPERGVRLSIPMAHRGIQSYRQPSWLAQTLIRGTAAPPPCGRYPFRGKVKSTAESY
jgi:hypothetical protein